MYGNDLKLNTAHQSDYLLERRSFHEISFSDCLHFDCQCDLMAFKDECNMKQCYEVKLNVKLIDL